MYLRFRLNRMLSSIDKIMQIKEDEVKECHDNEESAEVKSADMEYQKVTKECKALPNPRDFWS